MKDNILILVNNARQFGGVVANNAAFDNLKKRPSILVVRAFSFDSLRGLIDTTIVLGDGWGRNLLPYQVSIWMDLINRAEQRGCEIIYSKW